MLSASLIVGPNISTSFANDTLEFVARDIEEMFKDMSGPIRFASELVVREIRGAAHLTGVPVCVWSSSRSRREEALLKDLGVSQFISKPSGVNQFMEIGKMIKDLLAGATARMTPVREW